MYSFLRGLVVRGNGKSKAAMLSISQELAIGYLSGIASRSITTPLNLVTVRLQTARSSNDSSAGEASRFTGVCRQILREEGLRGFWKGFTVCSSRSICWNIETHDNGHRPILSCHSTLQSHSIYSSCTGEQCLRGKNARLRRQVIPL